MTAITIDLPDVVARPLRERAAALSMSLEAYASELLAEMADADESGLPPAELTDEEIEAARLAVEAFARGEFHPHDDVMAAARNRRT